MQSERSSVTAAAAAARVKFLRHVAVALTQPALATSAFLQHRVDDIAGEQDITVLPDSGGLDACRACGSFFMHATSPTLSVPLAKRASPTASKDTAQSEYSARSAERVVEMRCHRCSSVTWSTIEKSSYRIDLRHVAPLTDSMPGKPQDIMPHSPIPAERGITKTRRLRKSNNLKAILAQGRGKSSATNSSDYGINLLDLMKATT